MLRRLGQRIRRRIRPASLRPVILMYHRIADPAVDPWGLAVRPQNFESHLAVLRRSRHPLSMSELVQKLEQGTLPNAAAAVTFDDGYVDNLREAKPRLAAVDVPATLFLTTGAVGDRTRYWWDELAEGILGSAHELDREVVISGETCRLVFGPAAAQAGSASAWRAWQDPRTDREVTYLAVWRRLRDLPAADRETAMSRLREILSVPPATDDRPMTSTEIAELVADGLFEIGGHTVTHPVLPTLEPAERRREILEGRRACERLVSRSISGFAYPHGAIDDDSRAAVHECGFTWACSTQSSPVPPRGYDRYALPRMQVLDWDGDEFDRALRSLCA